MKVINILILFTLVSCANKIYRRSVASTADSFSGETMFRFSNVDLTQVASTHKDPLKKSLASCYAGDIDAGLEGLKSAMKANRTKKRYWNYLANCYFLKNDYVKSEYFYQMSMRLPGSINVTALNNLGLIELRRKNYAGAIDLFKKAIYHKHGLRISRYNLSQAYLLIGNYQKAKNQLEVLQKFNSSDKDVISSLAITNLLLGDIDTSIALFSKLGSEEIKRFDNGVYFAMALYKKGNYEKALDLLDERSDKGLRELKIMANNLEKVVKFDLEKKEEESEKKKI